MGWFVASPPRGQLLPGVSDGVNGIEQSLSSHNKSRYNLVPLCAIFVREEGIEHHRLLSYRLSAPIFSHKYGPPFESSIIERRVRVYFTIYGIMNLLVHVQGAVSFHLEHTSPLLLLTSVGYNFFNVPPFIVSGAVPHIVYFHTGSIPLQNLQEIEPFGIVPGSLGSRQAWVACVLIVLFAPIPEVVGQGLLDSSLGKMAYTSHSAVSLYSLHMTTIDLYETIIYKQIWKVECV